MNILIVDDHDVIRHSLSLIINAEFPAANCVRLGNAASCLERLAYEKFDLLILDMSLPDMNGMVLTETIIATYPQQVILIFSMNPVRVFAKKMYQLGVMGYLSKQADVPEITRALRIILIEKKIYFGKEFKDLQMGNDLDAVLSNPIEKLSPRELTIAQLLAQGKTSDEIASQLKIEPATIRTYKGRIFHKLEVHTMHEFLARISIYKLV